MSIEEKIQLIEEGTLEVIDSEDPWYTGNFQKVFDEIKSGIDCIIKA